MTCVYFHPIGSYFDIIVNMNNTRDFEAFRKPLLFGDILPCFYLKFKCMNLIRDIKSQMTIKAIGCNETSNLGPLDQPYRPIKNMCINLIAKWQQQANAKRQRKFKAKRNVAKQLHMHLIIPYNIYRPM